MLVGVSCSSGVESAEVWGVGRDRAVVWEVSSAGVDPDVELLRIADGLGLSFDGELAAFSRRGLFEGSRLESERTLSYSTVDQPIPWGFGTEDDLTISECRRLCSALPYGEDEALRRAEELFVAIGLDLDDFSIRVSLSDFGPVPGEVVGALVLATLLIDGTPTSLTWVAKFGSDGELHGASGYFVDVVEWGEVAVLSKVEALEMTGRVASEELLESTVLTLQTTFDRESGSTFLVPVYSTPLDADLGLTTNIPAARPIDLPG